MSRPGGLSPRLRPRLLDDATVREIRRRREAGESVAEIAGFYGITRANVYAVIEHRTYRDVA